MSAGRRLLLAAAGGSGSFTTFVPSAVAPSGSRTSLWSAGNTYVWGGAYREGVLSIVYTETPTSEHASGGKAKFRSSSDLGLTWGSVTDLYSGSGGGFHGEAQGLTLSRTGRLIASVIDDPNGGGSVNVTGYTMYSDDGGATWSSAYALPITASGSEKYGLGPAAQLDDGTLVLAVTRTNPVVLDTVVLTSTDDGATWGSQVTVATGAEYTEGQLGRVSPSGNLVMLMRQDTSQHTFRSVSTDNGATWSAVTDVMTASGPPQFIPFYGDDLFAVLRSDNVVYRPRYSVSWDAGVTWAALAEVDAGETRELDSAAIVQINSTTIVVIYALVNTSTSSTVYRRVFTIA